MLRQPRDHVGLGGHVSSGLGLMDEQNKITASKCQPMVHMVHIAALKQLASNQ